MIRFTKLRCAGVFSKLQTHSPEYSGIIINYHPYNLSAPVGLLVVVNQYI